MVGERDERAAWTAAAAVSEQYKHRGSAIRGLALRADENDQYQVVLESSGFLDSDFDYGMAIFSSNGELLAASPASAVWMESSTQLPALLEEARKNAGSPAVYSSVSTHPNDGDLFMFTASAADQDSPVAVGAFSPVTLAEHTLAGAFSPGENSTAIVIDQDRLVIYQVGDIPHSGPLAEHPGVSEALQGKSGTKFYEVNGKELVIAFSPIPGTGWAILTEEPWESVTSTLLNTTLLAPLVLVPVLLVTLAALWFGARRIVQPLQDLEIRSAELAWGNYEAIEESVGGIEEIALLQNTLIYLAQKIQSSQAGLHGYIAAITTGQEEERQRLARELHDETIQSLIALNQQLHLSQQKLEDAPNISKELKNIQTLTEQIIQDLRRVIRALRPLYLEDLGLVAALQMLAREIQESSGIPIEFKQTGIERRLPPKTDLALYRIAQEGLSNIDHHAQATLATMTIAYTADSLSLTITDNGIGFQVPESPAEFTPGGHFGLLGIYERAELIDAQIKIHSVLGEGTELSIHLSAHDQE